MKNDENLNAEKGDGELNHLFVFVECLEECWHQQKLTIIIVLTNSIIANISAISRLLLCSLWRSAWPFSDETWPGLVKLLVFHAVVILFMMSGWEILRLIIGFVLLQRLFKNCVPKFLTYFCKTPYVGEMWEKQSNGGLRYAEDRESVCRWAWYCELGTSRFCAIFNKTNFKVPYDYNCDLSNVTTTVIEPF